jgi:hypothetical protein
MSIKAKIRHFPGNILAEDTSEGLVTRCFDVISVEQMSATGLSYSVGIITIRILVFLLIFPRTAKPHIFRLHSFCNRIKMEAYNAALQLPKVRPCLGKLQATSTLPLRELVPLIIGAVRTRRRGCESSREQPNLQREGCSLPLTTRNLSLAVALRNNTVFGESSEGEDRKPDRGLFA